MTILSRTLIAGTFAIFGAATANAQDCVRRDHATGTVLGAAGGAAIGGAVGGDAREAIAGAVLGGVAGNVISRSQDCERAGYRREDVRQGPSVYLGADFDRDENWRVESYNDFSNDYRQIWSAIERGRGSGTLSRYEASNYRDRLRQIQERADRQQRRGRFNARDIQEQLQELRLDIRSARRENRDDRNDQYDRRR